MIEKILGGGIFNTYKRVDCACGCACCCEGSSLNAQGYHDGVGDGSYDVGFEVQL